MQVSVSDAKAQLTDLVRRAEAGDEIILTRRGEPTVRLVPIITDRTRENRRAVLETFRGCAKGKLEFAGSDAAHSQDHLYDERGLPA